MYLNWPSLESGFSSSDSGASRCTFIDIYAWCSIKIHAHTDNGLHLRFLKNCGADPCGNPDHAPPPKPSELTNLSSSHPSLSGASFTLNMDRCCSACIRPSFSILASIRASSPSILRAGFGVMASSTKWLSQCGQYSSLGHKLAHSHDSSSWLQPVLELLRIFPETLLALFAREGLP